MTAEEMIKFLSTVPPEAQVLIADESGLLWVLTEDEVKTETVDGLVEVVIQSDNVTRQG